ncbi:MAG: Signal-transduction histidine kinase senX3 [Acidobacteria bacterium ADurb.Bin340]|nr:MAG: Signal-transduction histidine kinase senX3 [Acidobacteria bacterium ADurb.Bin340]HQL48024.1 HAMP domain-containing sensor histidine kinase [Holophaga sp.]
MAALGWILAGCAVGFGMGALLARRWLSRPKASAGDRVDFVRTFAHAVRNPLGGIQLLVELGLEESPDEASRRTLNRIQGQVDTLTEVVARFSEANALDGGRIVLTCQAADLSDLVVEAGEGFQPQAIAKGQELSIQSPRPGPVVWGDPGGIQRILGHLLSNAIAFSPGGARIRIEAGVDNGLGMVRVSDDGPGIPEAERERIFERFAHCTNHPTGGEPSAGLGLSVARGLAEAMGGSLRLEPHAGTGSTFVLRLPRVV